MKTSDLLFWTPRIICILTILFVSLFAFDAFSPELTIWQQIGGFLIHLIPSFILLGLLIIAWKWEKTGGIILTIIGVVFTVAVFNLNYQRNHSFTKSFAVVLMLCMPFILAGILFIVDHYYRVKNPEE
jgi:hypothetical protein